MMASEHAPDPIEQFLFVDVEEHRLEMAVVSERELSGSSSAPNRYAKKNFTFQIGFPSLQAFT